MFIARSTDMRKQLKEMQRLKTNLDFVPYIAFFIAAI